MVAFPEQPVGPAFPQAADMDVLLRRAEVELKAGHFQATRGVLLPLGGMGNARADFLLACAHAGCGEYEHAATSLMAVGLSNDSGRHAASDLVTLFGQLDRRADSLNVLRALVRRVPDDPRILDALGDLLSHLGEYDEALDILDRSLAIRPHAQYTRNLKAIALLERGDIEEASRIFRSVLDMTPDNAVALSNLACIHSALNEPDASLALYRTALQRQPGNAVIRLNHSVALLKAGRFAQGWSEHEWRLRLPGHTNLPPERMLPALTDDVELRGRRVLITQEEGLGDTLMYLRYIAPLARRGAIVSLWVPNSLASLCRRVEGVAKVYMGSTCPDYDWHCPFISLPRVFMATPDAMGAPVPYLKADEELVERFAPLLPQNGRLNVGLVWGGAPRRHMTTAMMLDRKRSMPLATLAPLAKLRGINLISFQKGPYATQGTTLPAGMTLYNPMPHVHSMDDTAALLMGIDVLVSVDTSVVHLAGGLGKPVLLMDRFDNCWRWLSGRTDSIWYPDLTIFRQPRPRDWESVVKNVTRRVREMAAIRKAA
ncbi:tetratricopeptide repeat protein [Acetobacter estunensis]|uniref:tetratricopeptide repeat protein n=1 Tax=Acetobacter estunensis TaxID=104097 RepID=UPI0034A07F14